MGIHSTFSNLEGKELFFVGSAKNHHGTYWRLVFLTEKVEMTYRYTFPTKKGLIYRMVKDKLLLECQLNPEKIETFVAKFDERLENEY